MSKPPPQRNKARSGKKHQFHHGKFEYHVCFQVDPEEAEPSDERVVLRTTDEGTYHRRIAVDNKDQVTEEKIEGIPFRVVKFEGVLPRKRYDCFLLQGGKGEEEASRRDIFLNRRLQADREKSECDPDVQET